ncbi:MAG: HAMP domain-containing histidine kinase [Planctomycetes bacterium]|nr:HAMP domain-containing histidine kinase [Planctomycetota bacterium]
MPLRLALPSWESVTAITAVLALAALAALGWSGADEARRRATADAFDAAWRSASAELVAWDEECAAEWSRWRAGDDTSPPAGWRAVALAFRAQPRPHDPRLSSAFRADRNGDEALREWTTLARDTSIDDDVRALAWAAAARVDPSTAGVADDIHPRGDRARFSIDRERARSGLDVDAFLTRSSGIGSDAYAGVPPLERAYAVHDVAPDSPLQDDLRAFDASLLEPDRGGAVRFTRADSSDGYAWRHSTRTDETRLAWISATAATNSALARAPDLVTAAAIGPARGERSIELRTVPLRFVPGPAMQARANAAGTRAYATRLAQVIAALLACGAATALLVRLSARRRDLDRQRNDFVCSVTHELKTPLSNVLLYAETLERLDGSDPAKVPEFARTIRAEAERLRGRIQQVLDVAAGRDSIEAAPGASFDPLAVVEAVLGEATPGARAIGATLVIASHAPIPRVRGSLELLAQAVGGLLDNAVKFGGANTVRIRVRAAQDEVWIDVSDEGPGVTPQDRPHVFEPFWRASSAVSQATPGSGLGLALVRRCVERLRGRVELLVTPAIRGATFRIALPAEA